MATHSSIFAWRIPLTEESGGLQYMGLQKVRHNWEIEPSWIQHLFESDEPKESLSHHEHFENEMKPSGVNWFAQIHTQSQLSNDNTCWP